MNRVKGNTAIQTVEASLLEMAYVWFRLFVGETVERVSSAGRNFAANCCLFQGSCIHTTSTNKRNVHHTHHQYRHCWHKFAIILLLVCVSLTITGQPRNSVLICRV